MNHFCLLRDPDAYTPHDWDLIADAALREYWLDRFAEHFEELSAHALSRYGRGATRQIDAVRREFLATIDRLRGEPASAPGGVFNGLTLGRIRQKLLRDHGLGDPYQKIKRQQNDDAIAYYSRTVKRLHAMPDDRKWLHLIAGVFAGNLLDLGIPRDLREATGQTDDFLTAHDKVKPRPWLVDSFDRLAEDLEPAPPAKWGKAVVFVDNAGSDFVLGLMPLARELSLEGTRIVLAANEHAVLNDVTADETVELVERLAAQDADLAALIRAEMFEVVSTGNDIALLDLADVSDELNEAAEDADLVILEGMGRAVESNFDAQFKVDALHLATLKDPDIAARLGGEVLDCVCKYTPADT